jgi:hypothetical protein
MLPSLCAQRSRGSKLVALAATLLVLAFAKTANAYADGLTINATFDPSVTTAEQAVINNAIGFYESTFSNPITVDINFTAFTPSNSLIGQSQWSYATGVSYATFASALAADSSGNATDAEALANLPSAPPTADGTLNIKAANMAALGLLSGPVGGNTVRLYMDATPTGGCDPTVYYCYNLETVAEHEIDEVLGLGSGAGGNLVNGDALPEDMFRYNGSGQLSFYANGGASNTGNAYLSLNGTTDLAQFDNQNDGADFGDWQSLPLPPVAQVQDGWITPCAYGPASACVGPTLTRGSAEVTALDAIGYNLQPQVTPEPASVWLLGGGALLLLGMAWRERRRGGIALG